MLRFAPLAFAVVLAGCVLPAAPPSDSVAPLDVLAQARALVAGLPCDAPLGSGTSDNVRVLGESPLDDSGYASAGELALHDGFALVGRYGTGGFNLVDVRDPTAPIELAAWDPETTDKGLDVKWLPDGTAAVVAGETGITLVDVRDTANLVVESKTVFAKPQAHMLATFRVAERDYVAAARPDGEDFGIWRVVGEPGARELELASSPRLTAVSQATPAFSPVDVTRPHDMFFVHDELLDRPLLWVANVWWGMLALDVSDPAQPVEVLSLANTEPTYTHTVQTVVVDGRRITMTVSEVGVNRLRVYDTTDLDAPRKIGEWSVPNPLDPQHNLQIVLPYVYLAHYRHGVFVFSFDDLVDGRGAPIARYASDGAEIAGGGAAGVAYTPVGFVGTWDVALADGVVWVTDGALRSVAFGCVEIGDAAATSSG